MGGTEAGEIDSLEGTYFEISKNDLQLETVIEYLSKNILMSSLSSELWNGKFLMCGFYVSVMTVF